MRRPRGRGGKGNAWLADLVGLPIALVMLAPFLYMVATALLGEGDRLGRAHPETFAAALKAAPFGRFFLNSAIFSGAVALGQVLTSTTAAYAFARLRFPGRDRLFVVYLSALMIPAVLLLVPRFLLISALGWVDSYQGLISTELVSVSGIFLLRQFFLAIPRDLEDAAGLEGGGSGRSSGAWCCRCPGRGSGRSLCWRSPTNGRVFSGRSSRHPLSTCRCWRSGFRACTARTT